MNNILKQPANAPDHALDPQEHPGCFIFGSGARTRVQLLMELKAFFPDSLSWPELEESHAEYIAWNEPFETVCEHHGKLKPRTPMKIFQTSGCPKCAQKNITEDIFVQLLRTTLGTVEVIEQYSPDFIGQKRYDVFLPAYNIIIELHGKQHYQYVKHFHRSEQGYVDSIQRDKQKRDQSVANGLIQIDVSQEYFYFNHSKKKQHKMINDLVRLINVLVKYKAPPQHIVYTPKW